MVGKVYYMKMTFEIPALLALRLKASVPKGQRFPSDLEAACEKANSLKLDTKDWENLNESETWCNLVGE